MASSSSFFFSHPRRARLFAGLARGEVSSASLEPPSVDDPSAFLLAPLSDALLHQQKRRSAQLQERKIKQESRLRSRNLPAAPAQCEFELQRCGRLSPRTGTQGRITSPRSWASPWAASFSAWGPADVDPTAAAAWGADAPRILLVPLGVELLSDLCAAVNPTFDSEIFFVAWRVFLLGAADVGGPEAPVHLRLAPHGGVRG